MIMSIKAEGTFRNNHIGRGGYHFKGVEVNGLNNIPDNFDRQTGFPQITEGMACRILLVCPPIMVVNHE